MLACGLDVTLGAQAPTHTVRRSGVFRIVQDVRPGQTALDEPVTRVQVFRGGVQVLATSSRALLPGLSVTAPLTWPPFGRPVSVSPSGLNARQVAHRQLMLDHLQRLVAVASQRPRGRSVLPSVQNRHVPGAR